MKEKNTRLIILSIILFLLVIGLSGYIVCEKFLFDKNIENNEEINDITKNNNNYQIFAENLKKQLSKYDSNNKSYQLIDSGVVKDGYEVYLDYQGNLFIKYFDKLLNDKYGEYKIADNVLNFYIINVGQEKGYILYFINEDGTVGSADVEYGIINDNNITIKKDIGYKDIVSIVSGIFGDGYSGIHAPIFIDINGNVFTDNFE